MNKTLIVIFTSSIKCHFTIPASQLLYCTTTTYSKDRHQKVLINFYDNRFRHFVRYFFNSVLPPFERERLSNHFIMFVII